MAKKTKAPTPPDLAQEITALRLRLLDSVAGLGEMANNLKESAEWISGEQGPTPNGNARENALCCLEDAGAGFADVYEAIRAISLKIEELLTAEEKI